MKQTSRTTSFDIVTIGAATRDVFVRSSHFERVKNSNAPDGWDACLPLGAKIPVDEIVFETGGGATNAAVTFARFGLKTACVSRVGNDNGGKELVAQLKKERIDTRGIQTDPKERTAYSIILLAGAGSRAILTARGASSHLDGKHIPWQHLDSSWLYLTSISGNRALLKDVFAKTKLARTHVAWNPGGAEIDLGLKTLLPHLMQSDVVSLNREEAAALADVSPRQIELIFKKLGSLPRMALIVTDGAHGAYVHSRGTTWHAQALKGKRVNTTGAGDAFGSGFVASLMKDGDLGHALKVAMLNAHGVVSHMGAKAGILKRLPSERDTRRVSVKESS